MLYEETSQVNEQLTRKFIAKVYAWMMLALLITGITAATVVSSPVLLSLIFNSSRFTLIGLLIAEFVLVIYLSSRIFKMSSAKAKLWFMVYAILNGVTLSSLLFIYNIQTVGTAFLITAGLFGVMSIYGYVTKTDLTSIGNLFMMGLVGLVIATVVNMFVYSAALDTALLYLGVFLFIGLIGYDTQKIKALAYRVENGEQGSGNASILGAMILYLDFINLFVRLVRILGKNR